MVRDKFQIGFAASILIVTTAENGLGPIIRRTVIFTAFKFRHWLNFEFIGVLLPKILIRELNP